jgi:hypothetical protein
VHKYRGIIPSKPFETLSNLDGYPYPLLGVRVLVGTGKGTEKKPKGYLGHTLVEMQQGKSWLAAKHTDQSVRTIY